MQSVTKSYCNLYRAGIANGVWSEHSSAKLAKSRPRSAPQSGARSSLGRLVCKATTGHFGVPLAVRLTAEWHGQYGAPGQRLQKCISRTCKFELGSTSELELYQTESKRPSSNEPSNRAHCCCPYYHSN